MRARAYQSEYKQSFTQTNDYSFCQSNNDFAAWNKVTGIERRFVQWNGTGNV